MMSAAGEQAASHGSQLVCHSGLRSFSTSVVCGSSRPRYLHLEFCYIEEMAEYVHPLGLRLISAGTVVGVQKLGGNEAQSSFSWTCVEDCGIDVEEEDEDSDIITKPTKSSMNVDQFARNCPYS